MSHEKYNRAKQSETLYQRVVFEKQRNKTAFIEVEKIKNALGVDDLIRVPEKDYPSPKMQGNYIVHFNLPITYSRLEQTAALPRIIQNGYFKPPETEKLPLLSYQSIWKAKVVDFIQHITYETLPPSVFEYFLIGKARNSEELKKLILRRYNKTLPLSTSKEILNQGLSVTYLYLEKMVSLTQK